MTRRSAVLAALRAAPADNLPETVAACAEFPDPVPVTAAVGPGRRDGAAAIAEPGDEPPEGVAVGDGALWDALLELAAAAGEDRLRRELRGFRWAGCALTLGPDGVIRLGPYDDLTGTIWPDLTAWEADHDTFLGEHDVTLRELLARLLDEVERDVVVEPGDLSGRPRVADRATVSPTSPGNGERDRAKHAALAGERRG